MPVHDWTRLYAGTLHAFHLAWITHLSESLNGGILPGGYYALAEQHGGRLIADVLTLQHPAPSSPSPSLEQAGVAVADAPPRVRRKLSPASTFRAMRRTLAIRHVSGHRIVALLELVSPANKDRPSHVADFRNKVESALCCGIHVLMADLFPPGPSDPRGMHGSIWECFDDEPYELPAGEPLTIASYVGGTTPEAWVEHAAVGATLPEMPLFLSQDRYVSVPLESAYMTAYRGMPAYWREVIERQ